MNDNNEERTDRENSIRDRDESARARDESARLRDERSRDRDEAVEASSLKRQAQRTFEGKLFVFQVIANIVVLGVLLILMLIATIRISNINHNQVAYVQYQNNAQLCAQHDIVIAVKSIGEKLGLPVDDIVVPSIEGLECP